MRGIKKLDIFMVRQFLLLFIGTFCISLFVLMMQFLWRYVDELIGKGLSLEVLGKFFWYMGTDSHQSSWNIAAEESQRIDCIRCTHRYCFFYFSKRYRSTVKCQSEATASVYEAKEPRTGNP